jgi:hypothetical protein
MSSAADVGPLRSAASGESAVEMKRRHDFSRIVSLSICFLLLLSLAEFQKQEPFGLHLDSDGKRVLLSETDVELHNIKLSESVPVMIHSLLDEGPCIVIAALLPNPFPRRSGPMDVRRGPLNEAGPGSPTVQRI